MKNPWIRRFRRQDKGSAMVEFAIVTPILIVLAFGVIDFGRAFFVYNSLNSVVRDMARYAGGLRCDRTTAMATAAVQGRFSETFKQYLGNTATVPTPVVRSYADSVRVEVVNYQYQPWTPIIAQAQGIRFTVSAVFRRETPPGSCSS